MLLIFIVKSGKSMFSNRGKKTSTSKDPLSFEIWIFRIGSPDCVDDRTIFVAKNST